MAKTITIRFKNNKVSKVTGARNLAEANSAALFGQAFADAVLDSRTSEEHPAASSPACPGDPIGPTDG
jgi:hypothetical protein